MRPSILLMILIVTISCNSKTNISEKIVTDQLVPIDLSNIKVGGEIGRRIDITIANNLLKLDIDKDFLGRFQKKDNADYVGLGKLIEGTARMAYYTKNEKVLLLKNHLIDETIKLQESDGYIGTMTPQNRMWKLWDICELGYIINGLVTNYSFFGDKQSLNSAEKAADYIIRNWASMPAHWEDTTRIATFVGVVGFHRTMLTLYNVTKDKRYYEFCLNQLGLANLNPGIMIGRHKLREGHVYGYMAFCLAQLELYRINPDEKLLGPTMKAIDFMTSKNGMLISGGAGLGEIWTEDQDGRSVLGETCATTYQLRVYDNLLRLKSDSRYGDIMERTIYNALFGAQSPDGRQIRYFTPLEGDRCYFNVDYYCCPCNYRRVISELPSMVFYRAGNGIAINLYTSSSANILLDGGRSINIQQETDYPNSGHVVIKINPSEASAFALQLRIPSWCKKAGISINGKLSDEVYKPGTFGVIKRLWKQGDQVILDMPMEWRLVLGRQRQAGRVAVMRGPLLFCLNPAQNESLAKKDGADLGRIRIDLASIEKIPLKSSKVRPDGIACQLKAGNSWGLMGWNIRNFSLTLTEFADPDGKCTYFSVPDPPEAVPDELSELWK